MVAAIAAVAALAPARFAPRPGWHAGAARVHACPGVSPTRCRSASSWAATVKWRDCGECPPHRTLARIPADGIAIQISLAIEQPFPTWLHQRAWPPHISAREVVAPFEGLPGRIGVYQWIGLVGRVEANVMLFFGRSRPTSCQLAAAEAELRAAAVP
jgi:hypothetical protein